MEEETIDDMEKVSNYSDRLDQFYIKMEDVCHVLRGDIFRNNFTSKVNYPINLKRLVNHVVNLFNIESDELSDLSPSICN